MTDADYIIGRFDQQTGKYVKDFYGQGWIYKDYNAFEEKAKSVCYIPELFDTQYRYDDFMRVAKGNEKLAEVLFDWVDWQSPETLFEDLVKDEEIDDEGNLLCHSRQNL
jgi:hypothetical protein